MNKILLGIILMILLSGCVQTTELDDKPFAVNVPHDWRPVSIGDNKVYEISDTTSLEITVVETSAETLEETYSRAISYYQSFDGYTVIQDKKPTKLAGWNALEAVVEFEPLIDYRKKVKLVVALKDGQRYSAIFSSTPSDFNKYLAQANQVIASLRV